MRIYIDHNVAHYFVAGFPSGWDSAEQEKALTKVQDSKGALRLSFSAWNIVESAHESAEKAEALGQFMDKQSPAWLHDRRVIQLAEVRNFVYSKLIGKAETAIAPTIFADHLSQIIHELLPRELPRISETAKAICKELAGNEKARHRLREAERVVPDALRTLASAKAEGRLTDEIKGRTNLEWIGISMPDRTPDGKPLGPEQREALLKEAVGRLDELLNDCPAMQAEELMEAYRTDDAFRKPKGSDAVDLQHAVPALAYCDAIVTNDGYLNDQCRRYAKETGRKLIIARSLAEGLKQIS